MATGFSTRSGPDGYRLNFDTDNLDYYLLMQKIARHCVDGKPAADVAPVRHGRWIELSRSSKCSECEFETGRYEPARKFCPACGALMDGEETPTCHDGVCEIPGVEQKEGNHVE